MKRLFQLLPIGLLCGLMITLIVRRIASESAPDSVAGPVSVPPVSVAGDPSYNEVLPHGKADSVAKPVSVASVSAAKDTFSEVLPHGKAEQTIARAIELEKMALAKHQRDQAAENTDKFRAQLRAFRYGAWRKVVDAQMPAFDALRKEAARSPDKMVPCTICDAKGIMNLCVVCDHTGKCPTCRGAGREFDGVCPTCLGRGKCFLCIGTGKMPCPFCQSLPRRKEVITPDTPNPPNEIPIN